MTPQRRLLFGKLRSIIASLILAFKSRIFADGGSFEAESCLSSQITTLRNLSLYEKASLILTPNAYKASKLYSLIPTNGTGDFTMTRASTAMRRNSEGIWESVANNVPRVNYPIGGGCPNYLFEFQGTNICFHSANFQGSGWTGDGGASIASTAEVSPIKDQVVSRITTTTSSASGIYRTITGSSAGYSVQFFVKRETLDWAAIVDVTGTTVVAWFNISTGVVGTVVGGYSARVFPEYNGFYRIILTRTGANQTPALLQVIFTDADNKTFGAVGTTLIAYAGCEANTYASSPIITTTASVTRVTDVTVLTSASSIIGQTEGVIYIELYHTTTLEQLEIISINNSGTVYIARIRVSGNVLSCIYNNNTSAENLCPAASLVPNSINKIAIRYNSATKTGTTYLNGASLGSQVGVQAYPAILDKINMGTWFGDVNLDLKNFMLFSTLLSNTEMAALTSL